MMGEESSQENRELTFSELLAIKTQLDNITREPSLTRTEFEQLAFVERDRLALKGLIRHEKQLEHFIELLDQNRQVRSFEALDELCKSIDSTTLYNYYGFDHNRSTYDEAACNFQKINKIDAIQARYPENSQVMFLCAKPYYKIYSPEEAERPLLEQTTNQLFFTTMKQNLDWTPSETDRNALSMVNEQGVLTNFSKNDDSIETAKFRDHVIAVYGALYTLNEYTLNEAVKRKNGNSEFIKELQNQIDVFFSEPDNVTNRGFALEFITEASETLAKAREQQSDLFDDENLNSKANDFLSQVTPLVTRKAHLPLIKQAANKNFHQQLGNMPTADENALEMVNNQAVLNHFFSENDSETMKKTRANILRVYGALDKLDEDVKRKKGNPEFIKELQNQIDEFFSELDNLNNSALAEALLDTAKKTLAVAKRKQPKLFGHQTVAAKTGNFLWCLTLVGPVVKKLNTGATLFRCTTRNDANKLADAVESLVVKPSPLVAKA